MKTAGRYYFFKFLLDGIMSVFIFSLLVEQRFGRFFGWPDPLRVFIIVFVLLFWLFSFLRRDYMAKIPRDALDCLFSSLKTFVVSYLLAVAAVIFIIPEHPSRLVLGLFFISGMIALGLYRYLWNRYFSKHLIDGPHRVLVAGAGEVGRRVAEKLGKLFGDQILLLGFLDDHKEEKNEFDYPILGGLDCFEELNRDLEPDSLFISISNIAEEKMLGLMERARRAGLPVKIISDVFDIVAQKVSGGSMEKWPVVDIQDTPVRRTQSLLKRSFDLVVGSLILLVLSPLFVAVALLIKLESEGPVFFSQPRLKNREETFPCFKFRTMYENAEERKKELLDQNEQEGAIFKIKDDPRITRVGKWLRRFSIDELPQLFNVLRGEMSLIGPRPPVPEEVAEYEDWQKRRLDGYAGMTGLWQVSGRSRLDFNDMCLLDIYYLENWSLGLDLKILLKTVPAVLSGRGAY